MVVKLADFGLAIEFTLSNANKFKLCRAGTLAYMAPEIF